ncbi:MAG: peptide chain release factor 2 [Proteobacteria bacterium]|nr:peptide chain release factor 2 [Pseudomonadota bacterium]MBU1715238.1 peptide chain release factor 2 [Pseudomonadota bacterium]
MSAELKQKLQDLKERLLALRSHLELDNKKEQLAELEQLTMARGFWDDGDKAQKIQREQGQLQNLIEEWEECQSFWEEAELLLEMAIEEKDPATEKEVTLILDKLEERVAESELERMFSGEHDANNALLTIHAGAGGTEAQDWASILLRMYLRWAEDKNFKTDILDQLPGDEAGVKSVTVMISGRNAYGLLRSEMGIHRLVRISPFDASGRRHTSFASVFIFPELDDDIQVEINEKDLRIDTYRASGAGGQHVNKTSSAVRITHLPSGIVVQCQNERSQHRNKDTAMKMLKGHLYEREKKIQAEDQQVLHGDKKEIGWGSQIRSYVLQPYRMIKDHRTGCEMGNVDSVLDGNLDPYIKSFLLWQN